MKFSQLSIGIFFTLNGKRYKKVKTHHNGDDWRNVIYLEDKSLRRVEDDAEISAIKAEFRHWWSPHLLSDVIPITCLDVPNGSVELAEEIARSFALILGHKIRWNWEGSMLGHYAEPPPSKEKGL